MVTQIGRILPIKIEEEMRSSYLDYAMSVIVARALPDVRDGLKPVQRRILYAMHEMGLAPNTPYRKSARIVGEVMGKFHPHGDSAIYDAMVRMAQPFSMRHVLVDGQGNFGSVDDDPPAAMRYTEARLTALAEEVLVNIEQETVDFAPNFDAALNEPLVLPARFPNLLVNGASGIAVGMATSIPPHNLREVCGALVYLIDHPEASLEELMRQVKGPDFPTGGIMVGGKEGIRSAYATGHGKVTVRAQTTIEELRGNRYAVIVTELPYQVNKATLVARIAELAKDRRIEGISEVRDESDREGMRIVVELRRDGQPQKVLNNLYKHTAMQSAFHINMVALVDGQPVVLSLKQALQHYLVFRQEVVRRRSQFELRKAQERAHLLEGILLALNNLDAVIALIRNAQDVEAARQGLMERFGLTQPQAQAILEIQLRRLAALERQRVMDEHQELVQKIKDLEELLADPQKVLAMVAQETKETREKFGNARRTRITEEDVEQSREELEVQREVVITLSRRQYVKRIPSETYHQQRRGGKGVRGMATREDDVVEHFLITDTHDNLLFFTNLGKVYALRCYDIPADTSRTTRGLPLMNLINLGQQERVQAIVAVAPRDAEGDLIFGTRKGEIKRMPLAHLSNIRSNGLIAMNLKAGDELVSAGRAGPDRQVLLVTEQGQAIRFPAEILPVRSRTAGSVKGIRLKAGDRVIGMAVVESEAILLLLSQQGHGKRTRLRNFPTHNRGGQGVRAFNVNKKTGPLAAVKVVPPDCQEVMVGSAKAKVIRIGVAQIPILGRVTQGVILWRPGEGDQVVSVACMSSEDETPPVAATKKKPPTSTNGNTRAVVGKKPAPGPGREAKKAPPAADEKPSPSPNGEATNLPQQGRLPLEENGHQPEISEDQELDEE